MDIKKELKEQTKRDAKNLVRIETCSARDCTGLIASKPQNDDEAEFYDEIYSYRPADYYNADRIKKGRG